MAKYMDAVRKKSLKRQPGLNEFPSFLVLLRAVNPPVMTENSAEP